MRGASGEGRLLPLRTHILDDRVLGKAQPRILLREAAAPKQRAIPVSKIDAIQGQDTFATLDLSFTQMKDVVMPQGGSKGDSEAAQEATRKRKATTRRWGAWPTIIITRMDKD